METPLDVLSRAASMVQTNDANREAALRQAAMDQRESPPKELPTKMHKYKRMRERQQMGETLGFDEQHMDKSNSRKCAGTQTPFSSLGGEGYPLQGDCYQRPGEGYHILDLDARNRIESCPRPAMGLHGRPVSPRSRSSLVHEDPNSAPLNLTTSSVHSQSMASPHHGQQRPSVITCASTATPQSANPRLVVLKNSGDLHNPFGPASEQSEQCDPAIEEHFRRSLGRNYPDYMGGATRPSNSPSPVRSSPPLSANQTWTQPPSGNSPNNTAAVSVTGSVDDHFAKSLGDTWTQIKAQNDQVQLDIFTGSVDDHFAKALGDTWLRIKAEREGSSSNSNSAPSSPCSTQSSHHSQPSLVPS